MRRWHNGLAAILGLVVLAGDAKAHDWPTWRFDAGRTGATPEQLPAKLYPQWTLQLPVLQPAWPEDERLQFDADYEPVVVGQTMLVASSRNDAVSAFDLSTGKLKWRTFADGPIRFAPIALGKFVLFGADDGFFYVLDLQTGLLKSRWQVAPSNNRVLGNDRLISVWPVRGGPVHIDDRIFFTAGVWPFEGTFLYEIDAKKLAASDGRLTRDLVRVTTLRDRTPQGYLVADDSKLLVPCGRAEVAVLDRRTRSFLPVKYRTSRVTSVRVAAASGFLFHGTMAYNFKTKANLALSQQLPVLADGLMYSGVGGSVAAIDLEHPKTVTSKDRRGKTVTKTVFPQKWIVPNTAIHTDPAVGTKLKSTAPVVTLKAGNRLYGHQGSQIFSLNLTEGKAPTAGAGLNVAGTLRSMIAANGRLLVVTREGGIHCFGGEQVPHVVIDDKPDLVVAATSFEQTAKKVLKHAGTAEGYCAAFGVSSGKLINELVRQSKLEVVAVDSDSSTLTAMRKQLDAAGSYGTRVTAVQSTASDFGSLPPYFANVIVSENAGQHLASNADGFVRAVFHSLRPYGGTAGFELDDRQHALLVSTVGKAKLAGADIARDGQLSILKREGALPGSADWTHEYGDPSNSLMSMDGLVKAPLGVLWFGGPSGDGDRFYNRHFWGPSLIVIDGRMFIQGPGKMSAIDVYTGRILWDVPFVDDENYRPGRRGNDFEKKIAGFHFLAVKDGLYLVQKTKCLRLDPATGKTLNEFTLPSEGDHWGRIRVVDDLLITTVFRLPKPVVEKPTSTENKPQTKPTDVKPAAKPTAAKPPTSTELQPLELLAMNRYTGKRVWSHEAEFGLPVVTLGKNRAYVFDGRLDSFFKDWKRRGLLPKASDVRFVKALDLKTGKQIWKRSTDVITTWIAYSPDRDVLLASNKNEIAAFRGKDGSELWKRYEKGVGFKGHPESLWDRVIIWNNQVLDQRGPGRAYNLETGDDIQRLNPITGEETPWSFTKSGHHCNYAIASPHLMTFRAASAGFCDIESGNTSRLEGFRPGCRNSLIPANGVLNAPNFAHGCVCGYSIFTSLALVHQPRNEVWSYNSLPFDPAKAPITRIGVNFGAPGDRMAKDGTFWIDYPNVGGSSPPVPVRVAGPSLRYFRQHTRFVNADKLDWVAASGVEGAESITIGLGKAADTEQSYTVNLHFLAPDDSSSKRVFDVSLQGQVVLNDFDLSEGDGRAVVKSFRDIKANSELAITLHKKVGQPVLSGIEIVRQGTP